MDKRTFLKTSILAGAGALLAANNPLKATAQSFSDSESGPMTFPQLPLPYAYNALEPHIDAQTMEIHYSKHYAAYTKNFNDALVSQKINSSSIEDIFRNTSKYPAAIRNQGGGYYNHSLFWEIMGPNAGGEPTGEVASKITSNFGSFAEFKEDFSKAALTLFGSGWVWLIVKDGKLEITTSANQDNPVMDVASVKGKPIFALDIWEHAYYLKHQNRRAEYIDAFWNVVNWKKVNEYLSRP